MSDDNDVEQLVENFQKALDILSPGKVEALIEKLDAKKNRKLLRKVKHVVYEAHSKFGTIKEKVSKAYKRVKIRTNSECSDPTFSDSAEKELSDREEDSFDQIRNLPSEDRYSPIIFKKRSTRQTDKLQDDKNQKKKSGVGSEDKAKNDDTNVEDKETRLENNEEEMDVDSHNINKTNSGSNKDQVNDDQINTNKEKTTDDKDNEKGDGNKESEITHDSESSEDIIECTPEKSSKKNLTLSLKKNITLSGDTTVIQTLATSSSENLNNTSKDQVEKEKENIEECEKINDEKNKDSENEASKNKEETSKKGKSKKSKDNIEENVENNNTSDSDKREKLSEKNKNSRNKKDKNDQEKKKHSDVSDSDEADNRPIKLRDKKNKNKTKNRDTADLSDEEEADKLTETLKKAGDEEDSTSKDEKKSKDTLDDSEESNEITEIASDKDDNSDSEVVQLQEKSVKKKDKNSEHKEKMRDASDSEEAEKIEGTDNKTLDGKDKSSKNKDKNQQIDIDISDSEEIAVEEDTSQKTSSKSNKDRNDKEKAKDAQSHEKSSNKDKSSKRKEKLKDTSDSEEVEKIEETDNETLDGKDKSSKSKEKNKQKGNNSSDSEDIAVVEDKPQEAGSKMKKGDNDKEKEKDASDNIAAEAEKNEDPSVVQQEENTERPTIPKIKLVDISKLLAPNTRPLDIMTPSPKTKKSVTFDSSVIILSSSDEETPKKDPKNKNQSPLKSAMRKTSKDSDNSDSDSKENNENLRNRRSTRQDRSPSRRNRSPSRRNRSDRKKLVSDHSSEDSDFENSRKSRRLRKHEVSLKDKFSKLVIKIGEKKSREEKRRQRYDDDHSSDEEDSHDKKKNKRRKDKKLESDGDEDESGNDRTSANKKKRRRKKDILETSSLSEHSDNSDVSDLELPSKKKPHFKSRSEVKKAKVSFPEADKNDPKLKRRVVISLPRFKSEDLAEIYKRKKEIFEVKNNESRVTTKRKSLLKSGSDVKKAEVSFPEADKNDPKLKRRVFISLPRFRCEDLPNIYKRNKEIFEVKKLTNMDFTRRSRSTRNGSSKNSDDSDKPDRKRIKLTLKLNRKEKARDESSDDERSSTEDNKDDEMKGAEESRKEKKDDKDLSEEVDPLNVDNAAGSEDVIAEACLEQIEDNSEKNNTEKESEASNSDKEDKSKKKDKKKNKAEEIKSDSDEENANKSKKSADKDKDKEVEENSNSEEENKEKDEDDESTNTDEDNNKKKKGKNWKKDKLLNEKIDSSDSEDDFAKFSKKKIKSTSELERKEKKRIKKSTVISDSDSDEDKSKNKKNKDSDNDDDYRSEDKSSDSSSDSGNDDKDGEKEKKDSKPARRRIKRVKDSSSDEDDKSTRKHLRRMIDRDSLSETTKQAEQEEKERKVRITEKQKKYNQIFELKADATVDKVVLDFDEKTDKPLLSVSKKLVKQLKPHQVQGVKFMWDACFESLERLKKDKGSGCILAHCMGLGKTLQVITLVHTLLRNSDKTKVEKIMVVCPVNTVLNWKSEFKKWIPKDNEVEVYELVSCKTSSVNYERNYIVKEWHENGGVLIIGYNMFRTLSNPDNKAVSKKLRQSFHEGLVDPGPDLVVCDEGHLLKNEKTNLSIAMNRIKTLRRIVLTGTPLQNNLREYWCMVQFIKPNLLGTYKEYMNRFVNPITNGQYTDSTQHDIVVMRRRAHVLHKLLDGVVQRQDYSVLEPYLPPKYEYVLFVKLTEVQVKLYEHYMDNFAKKSDGSNRTSFLFTDFQQFQRISTHPRVLLDKSIEDEKKKELDDESESEGSLKDFIDDNDESESSGSSHSGSGSDASDDEKKSKKKKVQLTKRTRVTRAQAAQKRENGDESESDVEIEEPKQWWQEYIDKEELDNLNHSAKIFLLFEILKECEEIGDKVLVFSQSLYTLNCIEYFLQRIDEATQKGETEMVGGHSGSWAIGLDYFRLDGSSSCDNRANWCDQFNNPDNTRARLFLISTKAGGLGINLVAANRVIIFDVSWNPSHDIQSIYRVYRFGQTKPSYIYRFVTYGAMEMKIYERQVTKQAISKRVIDEQQIDRHYSQNDIQELYKTDLKPTERPIPLVPKDVLLGEMLQKYENTIFKYHEHQSLLENKQDEQLNEEERKAAWDEFENEKVLRKTTVTNVGGMNFAPFSNSMSFSPQLIQVALANIVRKDNPAWSEVQIRGILPALVAQLQMQMSENDFSLYSRIQQEIRLMQAIQAQRLRENYLQQYNLQQMLQKQQLSNQMMGNMNVTPDELRRIQMAASSQNYVPPPQKRTAGGSADIIELND